MTAIVSGTFDPITVGHEDIIRRAAELFGSVVVAVTANSEKHGFFTPESRFEAVTAVFDDDARIEVRRVDGLISEFAAKIGGVIVRGIRNTNDFDYEKDLYQINDELEGIETVFLPARKELEFISSTFVREIFIYGRPAERYVPEKALSALKRL